MLGGATGQIGDPSGKSMDRPHLEKSHIQGNLDALHSQVSSVLASTRGTEEHPIRILNNTEWTEKLSCIQFFREVGRHFRVAHMLARDSVKSRLDNGGTSINSNMSINGLGYHEFSYMCFQALDYAHLFETKNVNLQIGGQDQWGNMMSGLDLIQKRNSFKTNTEKTISRENVPDSSGIVVQEYGLKAHVLTNPLLTTPSGEKYGKSAGNAVWLDPNLSSPFDFYQYFLKIPDDSIEKHLKYFTFFSLDEIQRIMLKNQVFLPCFECLGSIDFVS